MIGKTLTSAQYKLCDPTSYIVEGRQCRLPLILSNNIDGH